MKKISKALACFFSMFMVGGCSEKYTLNYILDETGEKPIYEIENVRYVGSEEKTNLVKIEVENYGIIIIELYPDVAPETVKNFKKLVSENFYDNLIFHRVIKDFMIQTGDPLGNGMGGSYPTVKGEFEANGFKNELSHTRGVVSLARRGSNPETSETLNSGSSQFFIVQKDSTYLDGNYAAFGKVIHGMDVVDKIADVKVDDNDKPLSEQKMLSVRFVSEYNPENVTQKEGE